jgi:hypothetical protein
MKNKIAFLIMFLAVAVGVGFASVNNANAQVSSFPAGCSSNLGYSTTTGSPCNSTTVATIGPLAGCTTALGYSVTSGVPCSGASFAISYLAGCSSIYGYSTIDGKACNGTTVAAVDPGTVPPVVVVSPGLPTTGAGGNAGMNAFILSISGLIALGGAVYLVRKSKVA